MSPLWIAVKAQAPIALSRATHDWLASADVKCLHWAILRIVGDLG